MKKSRVESRESKAKQVACVMQIAPDGRVSFRVRGYDFRYSDMDIAVNGYLFRPVRPRRVKS